MSPFPSSPQHGQLFHYGAGQKPPTGAVFMSDIEVLNFSKQIIEQHSRQSEVLALRYSQVGLGSAAFLGSYFVNHVYREALRIPLRVGFMSSYLPAVFLASFPAALFHKAFVQDPVVLGQLPCLVCAELRGGAWQVACGFLYPMLLCPISSLYLARKHQTYPLTPEAVRVLPMLRSLLRPRSRHLWALLAAQFVLGMAISAQEAVEANRMWLQYANQHETELERTSHDANYVR